MKKLFIISLGLLMLSACAKPEEPEDSIVPLPSETTTIETPIPTAPPMEAISQPEIDFANPGENLWTLAEIAMEYSFPARDDNPMTYTNPMFEDLATGRELTAAEIAEFRTIVQPEHINEYWDIIGFDDAKAMFADLNGDGVDEACFIRNDVMDNGAVSSLAVFERVGDIYMIRADMMTPHGTFHLIENEGAIYLASIGSDTAGGHAAEFIGNEVGSRAIVAQLELRLISISENWSAQGVCITEGELMQPENLAEGIRVLYYFYDYEIAQ